MPEFMLMFRGGDAQKAELSPEELQQYLARWHAWVGGIRERGVWLSGRPLDPTVSRVVNPGGLVSDGPFPEAKEMVGGYVAVAVDDLEAAVEIAKGCPIYECQGKVEVRLLQDDANGCS